MTRRVLVARLDSVGDVLLSGPAVRAIAADSQVLLMSGPQGAPAAALLPGPVAVRTWSCPWIGDASRAVDELLLTQLREIVEEFAPDEAVILTSFHQSPLPLALLLRLYGVRRLSGASIDFAGALLDVRLVPGETLDEDQPEPERALAIAAAAGFTLPPGDDGRLLVRREGPLPAVLAGVGPYLVVHPGAAVPARAWPPENAARAVELLAEEGLAVVVTGRSGERALTAAVAGSRGIDLGGMTDFAGLAEVLAQAEVVISGNTGPAHLAAAVGTPVVSLFAPVVPALRWAPYGVPLALLGNQQAPCADSRARMCPIPGHPCLAEVSAEEAVTAALSLRAPQTALVPSGARA
ncbi:glycosyltransferase family 9 protein [Rathayibacter toxicus]|uniref:Glycosyl transferase n=1 Tax=Rathayibacter toxicus TaxID=145458 RepID=A0A0C5BRT1_9MICO|nr:glycosyltransferase family 9 protein [Rathayibacter toxicus]AJM77377.1 glycosyl transferase [Rathayibacter toxicus]ALS56733.1 glycosyl transferase [Rathayibacter toxicus]KKM46745.1 glycosyl transferase [Rathayibacter toxicus]PPG22481.1 glycosyltransferase family 9 protein [Rathayibacter toxicus]PPG47201.1 glycosyltransferase family 9 protein [Rathayibacter toxicus]